MRGRWYAAALAGILATGLGGCAVDRHDRPLLASDTPLWGLTQAGQSDFDSVTVAGETVLVATNPSSQWTLDARDASTGAVRWSHRISTYPVHGYRGGRAESGPVVVESDGRRLALIKDFSLCDDHGNCSVNWQRVGITALDVSTGVVLWSTMDSGVPEAIPTTPNRWLNVRLLGVTDGVAVLAGTHLRSGKPVEAAAATVLAVDVATGKRLWKARGWDGVGVGGGRVIVNAVRSIDGVGGPELSGDISGLDARRGDELWRVPNSGLQARGTSDELVLADPLDAESDDASTLIAVGTGERLRAGEVKGECRWMAAMVACVGDQHVRIYTGATARERTLDFEPGTPGINDPVGDLIPLTSSYVRGAISGGYAIAADGTVYEGPLPGPLLSLGERYAAVEAGDTLADGQRLAIYEVAR